MRLLRWFQLPSSSHTVALASVVAFGTQVVFALLMLRLFTPQAVGEFSLLSQIGFFWMTLALSQAPLRLLANAHVPAHVALREAWRSSLRRGVWLLPVAAGAVWLSGLTAASALLWVLLLAVCQMGWMLAQSVTLRVGSRWQQATVRVLPPLTAALAALCGAWMAWPGPTLVWSAVLGYALGAAWLVPAWQGLSHEAHTDPHTDPAQSDPRSAGLRFAHTLSDALLATSLVVVWQRLYGAQDTGWLTALLRVLGFVPALVHMAWAQVVLAQGQTPQHLALGDAAPQKLHTAVLLGLIAAACVLGLGWICALALEWHWLDARWAGVWAYLVPVTGWQVGACLLAAVSHRPFQTQAAVRYSWACIALTGVQAGVLWWPVLVNMTSGVTPDAAQHIATFACVSGLGLLALSVWMARLR